MNIPEAAIFADALDGLGCGLFLVDATGRIVYANASAHAMLHERSVLRDADGLLVACEARAAAALRKIVAIAASGDPAAGARPIAVPLSTRDSNHYVHYVAYVLPLTSGDRRRAGAYDVAVAA